MQPIKPCLWFDRDGEDAARFYTGLFPNSEITTVSHYTDAGPLPAGTAMLIEFTLDGRPFQALNGGPEYQHSPAVSFAITCADADEVDRYWTALTADGGEEVQCGWCTDRFGISWQVVPAGIEELLSDPDPARVARAMQAMFGMKKLDLAAMRAAADAA